MKNEASTLTRLMMRCTMRSSFSTSYPKMRTYPVSGMSKVESMRMRVDFPEPFAPRMPMISRRLTLMVTLSTARTSRFSSSFCTLPGQRNKGLDFLNIFETPIISTASLLVSITIACERFIPSSCWIATSFPPFSIIKLVVRLAYGFLLMFTSIMRTDVYLYRWT